MGKSLKDLLDEFPESEREEILAETARLSAEYRALLEIVRMTKSGGLRLSELREHVETNGGKLRLVVEFPGQEPVDLADIDDTADSCERRDVESSAQSACRRRRGSKGHTVSIAARR